MFFQRLTLFFGLGKHPGRGNIHLRPKATNLKFEAPEAPPATAAAPTAGGGAATAAAPTAVVEVRKKSDAMEIEVLGIFTPFRIEKQNCI